MNPSPMNPARMTEVEILLVEDNQVDAELTLRALRESNLANRIVHMRDGQAAVDWLFGPGGSLIHRPKVVLLDLKLPKLDGLEVLRAIRGNPATATLPVVMLTSSNVDRDVIESYKLGVNSYVVKPMSFKTFAAAIVTLGQYWMLVNRDPPQDE